MRIPTLDLTGGHKIPVIGLGTAGKSTSDELERAVEVAVENGYRHFDTAYIYRNEERLGKVFSKIISSGKVKREELFFVTKLPHFANTPDRVEEYLKESLKRLQLDYVDLYLIHFPVWSEPKNPDELFGEQIPHPTDHVALWKKMEEQVDAGRTRTIGLSNFNINQISKILNIARIKPATLQVELHIFLQSKELVNFCQQNEIVVVAYSPLGAPSRSGLYSKESGLPSSILQDPIVAKIAAKHNKSPGQILLKYLLCRNIVVIPKSFNPERIKENIDLFDFNLDQMDLDELLARDVGEKARLGIRSWLKDHPDWPFTKVDSYYVDQ